jgi:hypothetical protein
MEDAKYVKHSDKSTTESLVNSDGDSMCSECQNEPVNVEENKEYKDMELSLSKTSKIESELLKQITIINKEIKAATSSSSALVKDDKKFTEVLEELKGNYRTLKSNMSNMNLNKITVSGDNFKKARIILKERRDAIELIKSKYLELVKILSRFIVKEDASNIMVWINYRKIAVTLINLNTQFPYLQLEALPQAQLAKQLRFTGCPSVVRVNANAYTRYQDQYLLNMMKYAQENVKCMM